MKKDDPYISYYGEDGLIINRPSIGMSKLIPIAENSETLKFSICKNTIVEGLTIYGAVEDCLDIVRGRNYIFKNCRFVISENKKTDRHVTIKGGVKDVKFIDCEFIGKGTHPWHIQLGDWTDYDHAERWPTQGIVFSNCVAFKDINKTKRCDLISMSIYAEKPTIQGTKIKKEWYTFFKIPKCIQKIYFKILKKLSVYREDLDHTVYNFETLPKTYN